MIFEAFSFHYKKRKLKFRIRAYPSQGSSIPSWGQWNPLASFTSVQTVAPNDLNLLDVPFDKQNNFELQRESVDDTDYSSIYLFIGCQSITRMASWPLISPIQEESSKKWVRASTCWFYSTSEFRRRFFCWAPPKVSFSKVIIFHNLAHNNEIPLIIVIHFRLHHHSIQDHTCISVTIIKFI